MQIRNTSPFADPKALAVAILAGLVFGSFFFLFIPLNLRAKARSQADEVIQHQPYRVQSARLDGDKVSVMLIGNDGTRLDVKRGEDAPGYAELSELKTGQQISFCKRAQDPPFYANGGGNWSAYAGVCTTQ